MANPTQKTCAKCGATKPSTDFGVDRRRPTGLSSSCRPCLAAAARARRQAHPEREAQRYLTLKATQPEVLREKWRRSSAARAEARAEWMRDKLATDPDYIRRATKKWREANRDKLRDINARRRASTSKPVDLDVLWTGTCGLCGDPIDRALTHPHPLSPSVDHIVPLSRGGSHEQSNLQWTHLVCNIRKGARAS